MTSNGTIRWHPWRQTLVIPSLLKRDRTRRIDRLIDYFGEPVSRAASAVPTLPRYMPWRRTADG